MPKYILKAHAGIGNEHEEELSWWTEEDYQDFENGNENLKNQAMAMAIDATGFEYWVEKVED